MRISLVSAHPEDAARSVHANVPRHLPECLAAALEQHPGITSVTQVSLPPIRPVDGDTGAYSRAAALGEQLVEQTDGADVVHTLDRLSGAAALVARKVTGIPTVVRGQPAGIRERPEDEQRFRTAVLRAADHVIVPSAADEESARRIGVPLGQLSLITDTALIAHRLAEQAGPTTAAGDRLITVLSGPPRNGLAQALAVSLARLPELQLVVAGLAAEGEGAAEVRLAAARRGVAPDRIEERPGLDLAAIAELVDASAAVVDGREDPAGTAALFAMTRARPVVGLQSPTLDDLVVDRVTGVLVPPNRPEEMVAALQTVMNDPFTRDAWGEAALDRARARFDQTTVLDAIIDCYHRVTQPAAAPV